MKKQIIILFIATITIILNAQTMLIHKKDGTTETININSNVNITFNNLSAEDKIKILKLDNSNFEYNLTDVVVITFSGVSINDSKTKLKEIPISLLSNYPNPFNPSTNITFNIEKPGLATVAVYNQKGELVKQLYKGEVTPGSYNLHWNGKDNSSKSASSGCYFTKVTLGNQSKIGRMLLVK